MVGIAEKNRTKMSRVGSNIVDNEQAVRKKADSFPMMIELVSVSGMMSSMFGGIIGSKADASRR